MLLEAERTPLAAGLLARREHPIAITVHALEGVAHPGHVLLLRDPAVAIGVHARQVVGGVPDLAGGAAGAGQQGQPPQARTPASGPVPDTARGPAMPACARAESAT